jgi:hypothetical protein
MRHFAALTPDRIGGLIWFCFSAAVFYGSWTMDRLASQGVDPVTAPGVLPGLLGIAMMGFSLVLILRRKPPEVQSFISHEAVPAEGQVQDNIAWKRLALSWTLCMTFAGLLLGRGLPFWLLASAFMFLHVFFLEDAERQAAIPRWKRALIAAAIGISTGVVITLVFQKIFLVRLP